MLTAFVPRGVAAVGMLLNGARWGVRKLLVAESEEDQEEGIRSWELGNRLFSTTKCQGYTW